MAHIFEKNIHLYLDKLEGLTEDELVAPDTRILVPILEKMRFIEENMVAEYYAEILAMASKKDHSKKVMITFIEILNRLTADEIKILEHINSVKNSIAIPDLTEEESKQYRIPMGAKNIFLGGSLPVVDIHLHNDNSPGYEVLEKNFNGLNDVISLDSPENLISYIDNMISLGLIERGITTSFAFAKTYNHLENHPKINKLREGLKNSQRINLKNGRIDTTNLGEKLLSLCSPLHKD